MLEKLPIPGKLNPESLRQGVDDRQLKRQIALINAMTPGERRHPGIINGSRRKRIAAGSGLMVQDVNRLMKQFTQMEKMMKKMARGGLKNMLRGMPAGKIPPGMR
jgi:signal recognition particle subunit SRP54